MRARLASLALLGASARGCFLRGGRPSDEVHVVPGLGLRNLFLAPPPDGLPVPQPFPSIPEEIGRSMEADDRRRQGKQELREACDRDTKFEECHLGQGRVANALHLERCLSHGPRLSKSCADGIKKWKKLLADMWYDDHGLNVDLLGSAMPPKDADSFAAERLPANLAAASPLPSRFEFLQHESQEVSPEVGPGLDFVYQVHDVFDFPEPHFEPRDNRPHHDQHPHFHHRVDGDSHDHGPPGRGPPPPHGKGMGPHGRPPHGPPLPPPDGPRPHAPPGHGPHGPPPPSPDGPPPHGPHGRGPHGPPGRHGDQGDHPRSSFSVLWSWLFEDSSDSSSSEDSSVDSSEDSSVDSSVDSSEESTRDSSVDSVDVSSGAVAKVERLVEPDWRMQGEEAVMEAERKSKGYVRLGRPHAGFREAPDLDVGVVAAGDRLFSDDHENPFFMDNVTSRLQRAPHDHMKNKRAIGRRGRANSAREREAQGREAQDLELLEAPDRSSIAHDRARRFPSLKGDVHSKFHGDRLHEGLFGPDAELHGGPHHGGPFGSDADFRSGFHHGGPFREHNRPVRGDHLRSRNRFPEEYENSEWFDSMDEGEGLVDVLLGFFFLVGAATLLLLPFFLLARALKRMARREGGRSRDGAGGADVAATPDGYQALPEDGGEQELEEDDDAIVVTGTPVNPPPSVNL